MWSNDLPDRSARAPCRRSLGRGFASAASRAVSLAETRAQELVRQVEQLAAGIRSGRCPEVLLWDRVAAPMVWCIGRAPDFVPRSPGPARRRTVGLDLVARVGPSATRRPLGPPLGTCRHGALWWHPVTWWATTRFGAGRGEGLQRLGVCWRCPRRGRTRAGANHRVSLGRAGVAEPLDQRDWPYHAFQKETTHDR